LADERERRISQLTRRSHRTARPTTRIEDAKSGELHRPHHIDLNSGRYRGKQILKPKED